MQAPEKHKTIAQQRRFLENIEFERLSIELPIARAISGMHIDKVIIGYWL